MKNLLDFFSKGNMLKPSSRIFFTDLTKASKIYKSWKLSKYFSAMTYLMAEHDLESNSSVLWKNTLVFDIFFTCQRLNNLIRPRWATSYYCTLSAPRNRTRDLKGVTSTYAWMTYTDAWRDTAQKFAFLIFPY